MCICKPQNRNSYTDTQPGILSWITKTALYFRTIEPIHRPRDHTTKKHQQNTFILTLTTGTGSLLAVHFANKQAKQVKGISLSPLRKSGCSTSSTLWISSTSNSEDCRMQEALFHLLLQYHCQVYPMHPHPKQ